MANLIGRFQVKMGPLLDSAYKPLELVVPFFAWKNMYGDHFRWIGVDPFEIKNLRIVDDVLEVESPTKGWVPLDFIGTANFEYLEIYVKGDEGEISLFVANGKIQGIHEYPWNYRNTDNHRQPLMFEVWRRGYDNASRACLRVLAPLPPEAIAWFAEEAHKKLEAVLAKRKAEEDGKAKSEAIFKAAKEFSEQKTFVMKSNDSKNADEESEEAEEAVSYPEGMILSPEAKEQYLKDLNSPVAQHPSTVHCQCYECQHDQAAYEYDDSCSCNVCMANFNHYSRNGWGGGDGADIHCDFCREFREFKDECDRRVEEDEEDDDDEWKCEGCGTNCSCCCSCDSEDDEDEEDED